MLKVHMYALKPIKGGLIATLKVPTSQVTNIQSYYIKSHYVASHYALQYIYTYLPTYATDTKHIYTQRPK